MLSAHLDAPCKINLHLRVKGRRSDGCHELESVFLALALGDTLHVELGDAGEADEFTAEDRRPRLPGRQGAEGLEEIPGPDNIALKAAALFRAKTGFDRGLRIRLEKRVPLGAGLGGGSSDGAATLAALNGLAEQAGHPRLLDGAELEKAAAELGSDVPFFLGLLTAGGGAAAWVTGRGEHIRPIEGPPDCAVLLANPGFPSNTAEAYRLLDLRRAGRDPGNGPGTGLSAQGLIAALRGPPSRWPYGNDFLELFLAEDGAQAAAYRSILEGLKSGGADFCGLSGSGSTCFGIFAEEGAAKEAAEILQSGAHAPENRVFTVLTFPLAYLGKRVLL
jgi:4-diphosphocytidyl-2-C-methyl-D-erythritol kinase